jgi:energy-coupling factor transporter ATP-binding protein EcfA2
VFGKGLKGLLEQWLQGCGCPHLAVIGRTGAGKTTLAKKVTLFLISKGVPVQVLDFDQEYMDLPLETVTQPFKIPSEIKLSWLLSQINRPELGGYGISGVLGLLEEDNNLDDIITKVKHDLTLPQTVKFAVLWRLQVLKKYFIISSDSDEHTNARFDLSTIMDLRERQLVQQILASILLFQPGYLVIEEGLIGNWLDDILALARRRRRRIIFVGQRLPEQIQNFELLLFTPYVFNSRMVQLPLPVNPALDKGLWWIGSLGIHRIKHVW